jgi:hypothetical protein
VSPAWDAVADGRLPALATLSLKNLYQLSLGDGVGRLARAFEAVAGTLKSLTLSGLSGADLPAGACYELGAAIGKLRRLKSLCASLTDGRDYHAMGRGMASSGGCPELFQVRLQGLKGNVDWLSLEPSLMVPSVRDLYIGGRGTEEEALLLCCGLVQMGYRHRLRIGLGGNCGDWSPPALNCMRAIVHGAGMLADVR